MNKSSKPDTTIIERIKREVETKVAYPLVTPNDFIRLSEQLRDEGHGYVSPTTLKRVWGYINDAGEDYRPGNFTLRVLCKFLGFKDSDDFVSEKSPLQSAEYTGNFIETHKLPKDAMVELRWKPDRICVLRHIDATLFEVVENHNSRLKVGDRVDCACFTQHAPAYFSRVFRANCTPKTYIAGSADGITYSVRIDAVQSHRTRQSY